MAEFGFLICVLGTSFGLVRIFGGYEFLGRLSVVAVIATLLAALLRRRGVGAATATIVHLLAGVVVVTNLYLGGTTSFGLPTATSLQRARALVPPALTELRTSVPPIDASTGLLLVIAGAIWLLCLFGDFAAFRVHARVQAVLPLAAAFIALGVPDSDYGQVQSVAVFASGLAVYALTSQHSRDVAIRWMGGKHPARDGAVRLSGSAAAVVVVATAVAVAATTVIPSSKPLLNVRHKKSDGGREVTTPFVGIRNLLGKRSNSELFTVRTNTPSYWRITALDTYDQARDIWVSSGRYVRAGSSLPRSTSPTVSTRKVSQQFDVSGLGGPWMPAAFEAARYAGDPDATFGAATSTLFAEDDLQRGDSYAVVSEVPSFDQRDLAAAPSGIEQSPDPALLETPEETPVERSILDDLILPSANNYEALLALQNWFRSDFDYDESADYSDARDPVTEFLTRRSGFCQQFSSVFALMARRVGLPSRVAVGFTMGEEDQDAEPANEDDGLRTFTVKGLHAHAWPEVMFPEVGWVAFEPTPGRGNPTTTAYTGVVASQASSTESRATTTTLATTTTEGQTPGDTPPSTVAATPPATPPSESVTAEGADTGRSWASRLAIIAIIGALIAGVVALRRRQTPGVEEAPRPQDPDSRRILDAWNRSLVSLAPLELEPRSEETPIEFADRAGRSLQERFGTHDEATPSESRLSGSAQPSGSARGRSLGAELGRLAAIETLRRYSAEFEPGFGGDPAAREALAAESDECAESISSAAQQLVERIAGVAAPSPLKVAH